NGDAVDQDTGENHLGGSEFSGQGKGRSIAHEIHNWLDSLFDLVAGILGEVFKRDLNIENGGYYRLERQSRPIGQKRVRLASDWAKPSNKDRFSQRRNGRDGFVLRDYHVNNILEACILGCDTLTIVPNQAINSGSKQRQSPYHENEFPAMKQHKRSS
ncbi:unnamed protein product, partial [Rhizoctonia solani]